MQDAIQVIKSRISIADLARRYLELRPMGNRLVAPCPFHQETKPSFSINEAEGTFYCFGCQAAGDIFDFYGRINGLDFKESLEALAEEANVTLEQYRTGGSSAPQRSAQRSQKSEMLKMHEIAAAHFAGNIAKSEICQTYIQKRGIPPQLIQDFSIGFSLGGWQTLTDIFRHSGLSLATAAECGLVLKSKDGRYFDRFRNRLMFPIRDVNGRVIAFGGRVVPGLDDDGAKYLNSNVTPIYKKSQQLFALDKARRAVAAQKSIMITEGYMDVLTLHQFGYTNAVAVLGTSFPEEQVKRISELAKKVELLFDGDKPGREAAFKACGKLLVRGLTCRVVLFPPQDDIDSLLREKGKDVFENLREKAVDGLDFCIQTLRARSPKDAIEWSRDFLKQIELPELFHPYATKLATGLSIDEALLREGVLQQKKISAGDSEQSAKLKSPKNSIDKQILSFLVRYPSRIDALQELGADLLLASPKALAFWNKIANYGASDVLSRLDTDEKAFWIQCRSGAEAAPLDNEQGELAAVRYLIGSLQQKATFNALKAAMQQGPAEYQTLRDYICALPKCKGEASD